MTQTIQFQEILLRIESLLSQPNLSQKKVLTFDEAVAFTGRTPSNLYKLTSSRAIPHSKPEGKMIYFDREELEAWMLRNPVRTMEAIDAEAATHVALHRKGGWQ